MLNQGSAQSAMSRIVEFIYLRKNFIFSCALLVVFWLLFYLKIWTGGRHFGWDLDNFNYPLDYYLFDTLRTEHVIPQWDPYVFNGMDFVGNVQAAIFYPPKMLFLLLLILAKLELTFPIYELFNLTHVLLFSILTYFVVRRFTKLHTVAIFAGLLLPYGGFMQAQLQHLWFFSTVSWLPLCILGAYDGFLKGKKSGYAMYIFGSAMMILAGFPLQIIALQIVLFGLFGGLALMYKKFGVNLIVFCRRVLFSVVAVSGLTSLQILPFLVSWRESAADPAQPFFPLSPLMTLLYPLSSSVNETFTAGLQPITNLYLGVIPILIIVPVAFLLKKHLLISKFLLLCCTILAGTFVLIFTPLVTEWLYKYFHIVGLLRPWMMCTVFFLLVDVVYVFILTKYIRIGRATGVIGILIILASSISLFINVPNFYNSSSGPASSINIKVSHVAPSMVSQKLSGDATDYAIAVDQTTLVGQFENWPRILKIRSWSGLDPLAPTAFLDKVRAKNSFTGNRKLMFDQTPDFAWLQENGVKYFVSWEDLITEKTASDNGLVIVAQPPKVDFWELPNARRIFSDDSECVAINGYKLKANEITIDLNAKRAGCTVRSTMNYSIRWTADQDIQLEEVKDGIGFNLTKLPEGQFVATLRYSNKYFLYGSVISGITLSLLTIFFIWVKLPLSKKRHN